MELLIVTGMSGAGKSNAANALEDLGFYCVDNIPPLLIPSFIDLSTRGQLKIPKVAIVTDARGGELFKDINSILDGLTKENVNYSILFLDASDEELVRRYSETRRKHPLCEKENITVSKAVAKERALLSNLRARANYVIDTTSITAGQLKKEIIFQKEKTIGFFVNFTLAIAYTVKHGVVTRNKYAVGSGPNIILNFIGICRYCRFISGDAVFGRHVWKSPVRTQTRIFH